MIQKTKIFIKKIALHYLHYLHFEGRKCRKCRKCNAKIYIKQCHQLQAKDNLKPLIESVAKKEEIDALAASKGFRDNRDQQAKAKFENMVKNLSREELAEKVSSGFYFTYGCNRSDPGTVTIGTWTYPAK